MTDFEKLKGDIQGLPMVDNHCHLFSIEPPAGDLSRTLSMSINDMPEEQRKYTLVYRSMIRELRSFLGAGESDDEVLAERDRRMKEDYRAYVSCLFGSVNIDTLLIDFGYSPVAVDFQEFAEFTPAKTARIFRIESVLDGPIKRLAEGTVKLDEIEAAFDEKLEEVLNEDSVVAIKSIIGYRTGLEVQSVRRSDLTGSAFNEKRVRDYFLLRAIGTAVRYEKPVQIHAAFGESNIDVTKNNPALLKKALEGEPCRSASIVLVHGGYPYAFEAGYLASVYPNVYVDISEMIPFAPLGMHHGLRMIFDMCPMNKVMYGSDGFVTPEIHWLGAVTAKDALARLFREYLKNGLFSYEAIMEVTAMVFSETAKRLYGLEP